LSELNITLLQTELHWQDPQANRRLFGELIEINAAGTDLLILPEMFTTGFTLETENQHEAADGATVTWMQTMAERYAVTLCGSLIVKVDDRLYNRLIWAQPDGTIRHYDKRHLFRMAGEDQRFDAGTERLIVQLGDWRICPLICYDLRFPAWSRGRNDYDLLLYVANWPAARQSAWQTLLPARAVENLCYVAGVNRTGTDGKGIVFGGGSMVADYLGNAIVRAGDENAAIRTTLSLDELVSYREKFPAWKDADEIQIKT
jgi:omega-amidase